MSWSDTDRKKQANQLSAELRGRIVTSMKPPTKLTVSEWADKYRRLSPESSAEVGHWKTSRAEYQREILDAVSDPSIERVVIMSCSQVGKTEMLLNLIGFHVSYDASPILLVQPTLDMAQTFSKDRLAPMLRDSPVLKGKVKDPRSRDSNNTTLKKNFPGGHITMCGANSASSLASRPIRIVLFDEVDRFPPSAGSEGDPIELARKRSATFWNRKEVAVSTPTIKGQSRIESLFEETDKREYYVPCKDCGEEQTLKWANVQWEKDRPDTASYVCEHCGSIWDDAARYKAIRRGKWRATAPFVGKAGFRLSGLYSPWTSLENAVKDFLEAKKLPETLRVFVNTFLGESWEDEGERLDDYDVQAHREDYGQKVPQGVVMLTAGADIQDDRIEVEVCGWGKDEESWSIDYKTFYGDPSSGGVWADLDAYLQLTWEREDGFELTIKATAVDSGGHHTQAVYKYCKPRLGRRIFAIKGVGGEGKPVVNGRPSVNNHIKCKLFTIGVDTIKEVIYSRLKIKEYGAGYCHFPAHYSDEYFKQLTAEKVVKKYHKGFHRREWIKVRTRNEALDCRVYAYAALSITGISVNVLAQRSNQAKITQDEREGKSPKSKQMIGKKSGFVNGWK